MAQEILGVGAGFATPSMQGVAPAPTVTNPVTATPPQRPAPVQHTQPPRSSRTKRRLVLVIIAIVLILLAVVAILVARPRVEEASVNSRFDSTEIPLEDITDTTTPELIGTRSLNINGPLVANDSFILSPSGQPSNAAPGQMYYSQDTNQLAYFNGSQFVTIGGQVVTGEGITNTGGTLANSGVLTLQGQAGNITLTGGAGITVTGSTFINTGVITATAGSGITVTNDGSGNITITNSGSGTGTVDSPDGTAGRIAKFTGVQTIADSLLSETGTTVTVNGDLAVTGALALGTALSVGNGGTGATSLSNNGVVLAHGTGALTAVTSAGPGLCFMSTAGAPAFSACPGGSSTVTSVNTLTGDLVIANSVGVGTTITIDDASTTQKGIAQFNATNFSASGGTINTIQGISTAASPTFTNLTLSSDLAVNGGDITSSGALNITPGGALTVGATGQTVTVQGTVTSITSNGAGNDVVVNSADTIELQDNTNITGNLDTSGTFAAGTGNAFQVAANGDITSTGSATLQGGLVTVGATSQAGSLALSDGSSNTGTLQTTALGANRVYTLPDEDGTVCLSTGNCAGAGVTLQSAYNNSTNPELTVDATRGALTIRDNATPIGANLFEVQNNAGSTTYLAVTTSGISVNGTAVATGNINSSGGGLQTGGTTRIDNSGNISNIGTISLSGGISGGTTYSGSGNINTSGGALQTAGTTRVDNTGNLTNIGDITGTGAVTIASSGAGNDITINGADQFIVQDAAVFSGTATFDGVSTFNTDVDLALAETENLSITNTVTGTNSVNVIGAVLTNNTSSATQQVALLQNAAGSGTTEGLLVLDNADTDTAVANGLQITSAAGGVTTAINVSDPDIVTALLFGANDITGTNFSVTGGDGNITSAGDGTLQGGGLTLGASSQAGTLALSDGSSNTGTLQVAALSQDTVYNLPDPGTGSVDICLTSGNCAGVGGGVTGTGTNNRLAKFTSTGSTIGNSTISDDGSTVATSVDVIVQGGDLTVGTTSQLGSLLLHDGNGQTTTLQAGDSAGSLTFILPTTTGSANQCLKQSGTGNQLTWQDCDGGGGGSSATLQSAYANGNSITTGDGRDIDIVLADTTTDSNFDLVVADGSTSFASFSRANGSGTADPAQILLVDNLDTDRALPVGIKLQAAAGGITTAIDATDAEIVDALSVAGNNIVGTNGNIDFTNFDVVGASGNITTAGDLAVNGGDITSSGALNITPGGTLTVGATGQNATLQGAISTITSSGAGNDIVLDSADTIELQDNTNVTGNLDVSGTLKAGTNDAFQVSLAGVVTLAGAQTSDITTAGATTATALTFQPGTSSGASSNGATLSLKGGDASGTTSVTGGGLSLVAGSATGASGTRNGGTVTIDAGTGATANGNITIGTTNAAAVTIGRSTITTTINGTVRIPSNSGLDELEVGDNVFNDNDGAAHINLASTSSNSVLLLGTSTSSYGYLSWKTGSPAYLALSNGANGRLVLQEGNGAVIIGANVTPTSGVALTLNTGNFASIGQTTFNSSSEANYRIDIDSNANETTSTFTLTRDNAAATLLTIDQNALATFAGDIAVNGGDITSTGALNITPSGALTVGATGQNATLQGAVTNITSSGAGNDVTLSSADQVIFQSAGSGTVGVIQIGAGGAGSTTPDYLALDVKSDTGDPAGGAEGYMYYNTSDNKFRCFQGSAWTDCIPSTAGVTTIGTIDSQTKSANGAVITGTTLVMQSADATSPGLVTTGSQSFAGNKTFTGDIAVNGGDVTSTGGLTLTASSGNISLDSSGTIELLDATNVAGNVNVSGAGSSTSLVVKGSSLFGSNDLIFDLQRSDATTVLRVTNDGGLYSGNLSLAGVLGISDGSNQYGLLQTTNLNGTRTYTFPDADGTVCLSAGNCTVTLQTAYNASTGSTTPEIKLDATRTDLDIQDADGSGIGSSKNFLTFRGPNGSGLGTVVVGFGTEGELYMQPRANKDALIDVNTAGGNNLFTVNSNTQRVGINLGSTNLPTATLDVAGTVTTAGGLVSLTGATTGDALNVSNSSSTGNIALFKDNSTTVATIADGGTVTFANSSDGTSAFRIQKSDGTTELFQVDTSNSRVYIGDVTADGTGAILVLDTKNTSGDPTGVDGAMYYNSNYKSFRCYEDGAWMYCNDNISLSKGYNITEDFIGTSTTTSWGSNGWESSGQTPTAQQPDTTNRAGQIELTTSTGTTGFSSLFLGGAALSGNVEPIRINGGETIEFAMNIATLSDGTNEYDVRAGLCDQDASCDDGLYFEYDRNSSVNWRYCAANGSGTTETSSSTAVSTGWHRFKIVVNAAGTSVEYFVDGTSIGTLAVNIPTAVGDETQAQFTIEKSAGTTARTLLIDYFQFRSSFTTLR